MKRYGAILASRKEVSGRKTNPLARKRPPKVCNHPEEPNVTQLRRY
jgi:hypothetical protein